MTFPYFSRRAFLRAATVLSAPASLPIRATELSPSIEYVGTAESIDVYRTEAGQKRKVQSLPSQHPSSITIDVSRKYLFAVNEIAEFHGLPTGSVESYRMEPGSGHLDLISRVPLSLSATMPRGLAFSPDRRFLVVAVRGGGLYNVLAVAADGNIGSVTQILKEIGCSINGHRQCSAHPHSVVFHPSGKFLFGTDEGADRINVFRIDDGYMTCVHRVCTVPGSGPAGLAIDSSGSLVRVEHAFSTAKARYRFDSRSGLLTYVSG